MAIERKKCECGLMVNANGNKSHLNSTYHNNYTRVTALLEQPCITFREIGNRLGVSMEWVRQIAGRTNQRTGSDRQKVCTLKRAKMEAEKFLAGLRGKIQADGLEIECLPVSDGTHSRRRVKINGKVCQIGSFSKAKTGYYSIGTPKVNGDDFVLFYYSKENIWMVMPVDRLPKIQTLFSLSPDSCRKGGGKYKRHDYPQYLNAWHLLKEPEGEKGK